jgi:hypothetical protein
MKRVRLLSLAAAVVVTAIQWAAFFSPVLYTQSLQAVADPLAAEMSDGELPPIVVAGCRAESGHRSNLFIL